ncbi:MAG: hypothetical protein CVT73_17785 [Alphaproteobacteria bacterium HGW-Alphaproteobacteria-12]|nr:MAG: hypothetical protein CVT73_17785 [Alphaproteobacteria bacterium HGW-Alphaproteobacteria-12]
MGRGVTRALIFIPIVFLCLRAPAQAAECAPVQPGLERFHAAISQIDAGTRTRPLTILHLGDSHIALDSFTRGLRHRWQARFGDAGRGLMPGVPFRYYAPDGFDLSITGAWTMAASLPANAAGPFGLQGFRASASDPGAVMTLDADTPFSRITLDLYGGPGTGALFLKLDDAAALKLQTRRPAPGLVRLSVPAASTRRARLRPAGGGPVQLLGWSVEKDEGHVRYDSYGVVAATASIVTHWDRSVVKAQIAALRPDLVILGYGTNEGFHDGLDMKAYGALIGGIADLVQGGAPEASLAVLGPFDGARRGRGDTCGGGWATPPKLAAVRQALRALAAERGAYFWDGAAAMGGRCSANIWAQADPPLAYADRVHLRADGAARLSGMLWGALMRGEGGEGSGLCQAGSALGGLTKKSGSD